MVAGMQELAPDEGSGRGSFRRPVLSPSMLQSCLWARIPRRAPKGLVIRG